MKISYITVVVMSLSLNAFAHNASESFTQEQLKEKRLIDTGDGKARWMQLADALKLSDKSHEEGRCGGFFDVTDAMKIDRQPTQSVQTFTLSLRERGFSQKEYLDQALPMLDTQRMFKTVTDLSAFKNRFYKSQNGVKAAEWIANQYRVLAKNRSDVKVEMFKHRWAQPSVIVTIQGAGQKKNEIVVVGGHEDSINQSQMRRQEMTAPGADDNATGIATGLEIFRVMMETNFKTNRTMMFMSYAGEEVGLLGSQDIADHFKDEKKLVVGVVQFDMTSFAGSGDQVVFMRDFTNPDLTKYSQQLMDTYVKAPWSTDRCGYACSDHASWTRAGYPSVMAFESKMDDDNKDIHSTRDVIQKLDFKHGLHFAKFGLAFMVELSTK